MDSAERIFKLLDYIEESPDDPALKYMVALEYVKQKNHENALFWMEAIHSNHSSYLPNYYHFGKLLETEGKTGEAIVIYNEGIHLAKANNDRHTLSELQAALMSIED